MTDKMASPLFGLPVPGFTPPKKKTPKSPDLKMVQIVIAPFQNLGQGLSYSTLALGDDGVVYRYDAGCQGWLALKMGAAVCPFGKEHRR